MDGRLHVTLGKNLNDPRVPWRHKRQEMMAIAGIIPVAKSLFLASTVSALHRNAHIWNASHPLLVTYYCWVSVYSPGMEAKKLNTKSEVLFPGFEPWSLRAKSHTSTDCAIRTVVPNGSYHIQMTMPISIRLKSQLFAEDRKNRLTPKISNHLFTCYLNFMCKSNPVCLIQQWSVIILLVCYV